MIGTGKVFENRMTANALDVLETRCCIQVSSVKGSLTAWRFMWIIIGILPYVRKKDIGIICQS